MTVEEITILSEKNRKLFTELATNDRGKFVRLQGDNRASILLGLVDDPYDFYWVVIKSDLNVYLSSCVGGYEVIEGELPPDASVLKWLQDNDAEGLMQRVKNNLHLTESDKIIVDIKVK